MHHSKGALRLSLTIYFRNRFLQVSLTNSFLQWLHLNNLCCESIAQDGMQASQIFSQWLHLNNLTWSVKLALNLSYFGDHVFAN